MRWRDECVNNDNFLSTIFHSLYSFQHCWRTTKDKNHMNMWSVYGKSARFKVVYTCRMMLMWLICKISLSHVNENCLLNLHIVSHTNSILNVVDDIKNCTLKKLATHTHHHQHQQQQNWHWRNQRCPREWIRAGTLKNPSRKFHTRDVRVFWSKLEKGESHWWEKYANWKIISRTFFVCASDIPKAKRVEERKNLFYDYTDIHLQICVHDDREEIEFLDKHK